MTQGLRNLVRDSDQGLAILYRQHRELMEEIETMQHQRAVALRLLEETDEDQLGLVEPKQATTHNEDVEVHQAARLQH